MTVAHPIVLVIAIAIALLVLPYVGRTSFGNRDQFIEDVGLADRKGHPRFVVDLLWWFWFFPGRGIWLNVLWLTVSIVIIVAVTYNVLVAVIGAMA